VQEQGQAGVRNGDRPRVQVPGLSLRVPVGARRSALDTGGERGARGSHLCAAGDVRSTPRCRRPL
jgi:hypothetical protein